MALRLPSIYDVCRSIPMMSIGEVLCALAILAIVVLFILFA